MIIRIERIIRPQDEIPDFKNRFRLYRAQLSCGTAIENPLDGFVGGRWEAAGDYDTDSPPEREGRALPLSEYLRVLGVETQRVHRVAA